MAKLEQTLLAAKARANPSLVGYVMGGIRPDWPDLVTAMIESGADAVEIGLPFSDPMLDGGTIQEASAAALAAGARISHILDTLSAIDVDAPLAVMTYANHLYSRGVDSFCRALGDAGVSGAIIPDIQLDEADEYLAAAEVHGVDAVLLASPATGQERLTRICERSRGFIYSVSVMGTTGGQGPGESAWATAGRLRRITDKPVLIGFGVKTPQIAAEAAAHADGVIVASALMRRVLDGESTAAVGRALAEIRESLDTVVAA